MGLMSHEATVIPSISQRSRGPTQMEACFRPKTRLHHLTRPHHHLCQTGSHSGTMQFIVYFHLRLGKQWRGVFRHRVDLLAHHCLLHFLPLCFMSKGRKLSRLLSPLSNMFCATCRNSQRYRAIHTST